MLRILLIIVVTIVLQGCTQGSINVKNVALSADAEYKFFFSKVEDNKRIFSPHDEKVTLHVRFNRNFRAVYEWFTVEWIQPDGEMYERKNVHTQFGSHEEFITSMNIRGTMAAYNPGLWKLRVWLDERLLINRLFRIRDEGQKNPYKVLPGVAEQFARQKELIETEWEYGCPPLIHEAIPGCYDKAPEE